MIFKKHVPHPDDISVWKLTVWTFLVMPLTLVVIAAVCVLSGAKDIVTGNRR